MKKIMLPFCILALSAGFFSSCDKEEDENDNGSNQKIEIPVANQKHLATMKMNNGASFILTFDSNGRISSLSGTNVFNGKGSEEYDYSNLAMNGSYGGETITGVLNADSTLAKVTSNSQTMEYVYDADKHIVSLEHTQKSGSNEMTRVIDLTWENDDIVSSKYTTGSNEDNLSFKYTNEQYPTPIENKGGLKLSFYFKSQYLSFINGTGAAGKHLPVSIDMGKGTYADVNYVFDEDGYPTQIVFDGTTIDFTWE